MTLRPISSYHRSGRGDHRDSVSEVKARAILEVANGPVEPEADDALEEMGVVVIPDVLANAGGVIVSWYEWLQNRAGDYWPEEEVTSRLEKRIRTAAQAVSDLAKEDTHLRRQRAGHSALPTRSRCSAVRLTIEASLRHGPAKAGHSA